MKKVLLFFFLYCNHSIAQSNIGTKQDNVLVNAQICNEPLAQLTQSVTTQINKEGYSLNTVNKDGTIYCIGSASTGVPSSASSGFINSRNIAFSKAVLRAKVELLKLSGESITTQKNFSLVNKLKN